MSFIIHVESTVASCFHESLHRDFVIKCKGNDTIYVILKCLFSSLLKTDINKKTTGLKQRSHDLEDQKYAECRNYLETNNSKYFFHFNLLSLKLTFHIS